MKNNKYLQKLGLSQNASNAYLELLKKGTQSATELSKSCNINRSTIYSVLTELIESGIATSYDEDGITKYSAEPPIQLIANANERIQKHQNLKEELQEFTEKLEKSKKESSKKPILKYFEGKKGVRKIMEDYLTIPSAGHLSAITNFNLARKFFIEEINLYNKKILEINYSTKTIHEGKSRIIDSPTKQSLNIDHKKLHIQSDIACYLNKISFISLTEKSKSLIIENKQISKTFESLFNLGFNKHI